jgi:tellurite methyltransferase
LRRPIVGYHQDDAGDWVAELSCGHGFHVRHDPPWLVREWVLTEEGRASFVGHQLECVKCEAEHRDHDKANADGERQ